jgi:carbonic anhydrase
VEGMMAGIGLMIIVKQLPLIMGVEFKNKYFWYIIWEAVNQAKNAVPAVAGVFVICAIVVFGINAFSASMPWAATPTRQ